MKQKEIISLLDEAIAVLGESGGRKLTSRQREKLRCIASLCTDTCEGKRILGVYAEDFHGCVGIACIGIFNREEMKVALRTASRGMADMNTVQKLREFFEALYQEISSHGLHSSRKFQRLACVGARGESFAQVGL